MELKTNNQNIIYLNWNDKEHIKAVSNLHIKLLPESILSKLGYLFLSKFYYAKLTKHNLIDVYLYKQKEEYAGFISCTNKPFTFMGEGKKKNFLFIIALLGLLIVLSPNKLKCLLKMKNDFSLDNLQKKFGDDIGQFLSFGVLEDYRKSIDPTEEITVPNVLMKLVSSHFKINNKKCFFLMVLKTNVTAIKFYEKHCGTIITSDNKNESVTVKFDL